MIVEIEMQKLMDTIEAAFAEKVAYDDLREALREIKDIIAAEAWEIVE